VANAKREKSGGRSEKGGKIKGAGLGGRGVKLTEIAVEKKKKDWKQGMEGKKGGGGKGKTEGQDHALLQRGATLKRGGESSEAGKTKVIEREEGEGVGLKIGWGGGAVIQIEYIEVQGKKQKDNSGGGSMSGVFEQNRGTLRKKERATLLGEVRVREGRNCSV